MRIVIAADHNGVAMKARLVEWFREHGHDTDDRGTHTDAEVDYPFLCAEVGRAVTDGGADMGVVVGGSGQGEVIACNKVPGVRAGLCHTRFATEISRGNNDANVLVLGSKVISAEEAVSIAQIWLATPFKGGRHQRRLDQIAAVERGEA